MDRVAEAPSRLTISSLLAPCTVSTDSPVRVGAVFASAGTSWLIMSLTSGGDCAKTEVEANSATPNARTAVLFMAFLQNQTCRRGIIRRSYGSWQAYARQVVWSAPPFEKLNMAYVRP